MRKLLHQASRGFRGNKDTSPLSDAQARHIAQDIPSPETPGIPLPTSPPDDVPENILAFRTITKLLSLIQQEQAFRVKLKGSSPEDIELSLSTAFATIAVIEHEIVAVVTKVTYDLITVVCATLTSTKDTPPPKGTSIKGKIVRGFEFFVAKNTRKDEPPHAGGPTISPVNVTGKMPDFDLEIDETLEKWVDQHWSNTTIPVHLRVLGKLLSTYKPSPHGPIRDASVIHGRLMRYVIATCYQKIRRRLRHKTLSQPFIKSLKQVETFNVDESQRGTRSAQRTEHDKLFLTKFLLDAHRDLHAKFPKLLKHARMKDDPDFELYTEDTCIEFHHLLILLLERFQRGLERLHKTRGNEKVPTRCSEEFKVAVEDVFICGYALQRLAHGAALRMHMKTIATFLTPPQKETSMPAPNEAKEEQEEVDEDLELVQPYVKVNGVTRTDVWQSHIDWLQLIMVQFDAVDVLVHYFAGDDLSPKAVSIHVATPPSPNHRLLPWQNLLRNPLLFPTTTTTQSAVDDHPNISNDDILNFFTKDLDNVHSSVQQLNNTVKSWCKKRDLSRTISDLETLESSTLPGWKESATSLLVTLKALPDMPEENSKMDIQIKSDIKTIEQSGFFFSALASTDYDKGFGGALHCEAFLASILGDTANVSKDLAEQMRDMGSTIGVSKCCCPACKTLLALLQKKRSQPFIIRGTHNTITACTLPTWLPGNIVDSMNDFVGGHLRQEFIRIMDCSQLLPRRAESTDSRRLSSDSTRLANDNNAFIPKGWGSDDQDM